MGIEALDIVYAPSCDVEADVRFYRDMLGARIVFAIEAIGTRVAEVAVAPEGPRLVLADHMPPDGPIFLHRVSDLDETLAHFVLAGSGSKGESSCRSVPARPSAAPAVSTWACISSRAQRSTNTSLAAPTSADSIKRNAPRDVPRAAAMRDGQQVGAVISARPAWPARVGQTADAVGARARRARVGSRRSDGASIV